MTQPSLSAFPRVFQPDLARHKRIREALRDAGSSIAELSAEIGVAGATMTIVSQGHRTSHRIQTAIAEKLGTTPEALFPERYLGKGAT
jgi:Ner family transcriptional regulator